MKGAVEIFVFRGKYRVRGLDLSAQHWLSEFQRHDLRPGYIDPRFVNEFIAAAEASGLAVSGIVGSSHTHSPKQADSDHTQASIIAANALLRLAPIGHKARSAAAFFRSLGNAA